jgi:hypothetical protein
MTKKTTSVTEEQAKLTATREETFAELQTVKRTSAGRDRQTEAMRGEATARRHEYPEEHTGEQFKPKPGTDSAKLSAEIKKRMAEPNPHQQDFDKAAAKYRAAELAERGFRAKYFEQILEELGPDHEDLDADMAEAWERIEYLAGLELERLERVRAQVNATPGIDGQNNPFDARASDWSRYASDAAAAPPLRRPGVDEAALHQLRLQVEEVESHD